MTNNKTHKDRKHRTFGGSTANQWVNCPGYAQLVATMPPVTITEGMAEGTKAHEIAEIVLEDFLNNRIHGTYPDIRTQSIEDKEKIAYAKEYCDIIWREVLEQSITGKAYGLEEEMVLDESLDIGGACDFWAVYRNVRGVRTGYIVDYKYGYHFIDPDTTAQLPLYAVSLRAEMRREADIDLDVIHVAIFQPRGEEPHFRSIKLTAKQLDRWEAKFLKGAKANLAKNPKYKVGSWCESCRANIKCPKYLDKLEQDSQLALASPKDFTWLPQPAKVDDATLARLILNDGKIIAFLKECRKYALSRAAQGEPIKGLKAVTSSGKRQWQSNTDAVVEVLVEQGVENPFEEPKLKTLTEIKKDLKNLGLKAKEIDTLLDSLCTKREGNPILVSEDDPRPAITAYTDVFVDESKTEIEIID